MLYNTRTWLDKSFSGSLEGLRQSCGVLWNCGIGTHIDSPSWYSGDFRLRHDLCLGGIRGLNSMPR